MTLPAALKCQYHASLRTLRLAIEACPDAKWAEETDGFAAFWRVAYHTLFYAHLYLQPTLAHFRQWEHHRPNAESIDSTDWDGTPITKSIRPYTREELLRYWSFVDGMIDAGVDALDLASPESGFDWYKMPKLEHQLVNIRHIQHHAAALSTRLRREAGVAVRWVGGV